MYRQATLVVRKECAVQNCDLQIAPSDVMHIYAMNQSTEDGSSLLSKDCSRGKSTQSCFISKDDRNLSVEDALALLVRVKLYNVKPDNGILCKSLKACAVLGSFEAGNLVYQYAIENELAQNVFLGSSLIDFYAKCGSIEDALTVFQSILGKNVVAWSAMISGLVQHKQNEAALELFSEMLLEGCRPNEVTYMSILRGCANLATLDRGRRIHDLMKQSRFEENIFVASTLVDMYSKCGSLADAHNVFCKMPSRNVVSYSALIAGYVQAGHVGKALDVFELMRTEKVKPDEVTFVNVLKGVAATSALEEGRKVHALIRKQGCEANKYVGSALVDMYAKCKSVKDAQDAFNQLTELDVVAWTTMIETYAECGYADEALACYLCMEIQGIRPVSYTFVSILKACTSLTTLSKGRFFHALIIEIEEYDPFVATALINMYVSSGSMAEAETAFHKLPKGNVALWNAMISGFVQHDFAAKAVLLFQRMQIECIQPNMVTFVAILKACSSLLAIRQVHVNIIMVGLELELVLQNALAHVYAKCGELETAQTLFDRLPHKNEISWNGIIAACVQAENFMEALSLFMRMVEESVLPNEHTFTSMFRACCHWALFWQGCRFHILMLQSVCYDPPLYTSLTEMYAKCGNIEAARQVFDNIVDRSLVSWNVMIMGYAQHGMPKETLDLFHGMQERDVRPNQVTLAGVLSACGHAGLISEGELYYIMSEHQYGITVTDEHMACVVALLGRAGQIERAAILLQGFASEPTISAWKALHSAYIIHENSSSSQCYAMPW